MTTVYRRCQGYCEQVLSEVQQVGAVGCKVGRSCQVRCFVCGVSSCCVHCQMVGLGVVV